VEQQDDRQIIFRDEWGQIVQTFDPRALDMPNDVSRVFVEAFRVHDAGSSATTRRGRWRVLRRFGRFLRTEGVACARDVNAGTIRLWRGDLDEKFPSIRMRTDRRGFQVVPALIDAGKRYSQV
jgi:hypothetical protein